MSDKLNGCHKVLKLNYKGIQICFASVPSPKNVFIRNAFLEYFNVIIYNSISMGFYTV